METCDICAAPLDGNKQVVDNDRVLYAAAALGVLNKTMGEFAAGIGIPREHLAVVWLKRTDNASMPWDLCPNCALRMERLAYAAEAAIKEKQKKKFWQFWKR